MAPKTFPVRKREMTFCQKATAESALFEDAIHAVSMLHFQGVSCARKTALELSPLLCSYSAFKSRSIQSPCPHSVALSAVHMHTRRHTHTHMHSCSNTQTHMQAWTSTQTCAHTCTDTDVHIYIRTRAHTDTYAHTQTHTCTCMHLHALTHLRACIHKYILTFLPDTQLHICKQIH